MISKMTLSRFSRKKGSKDKKKRVRLKDGILTIKTDKTYKIGRKEDLEKDKLKNGAKAVLSTAAMMYLLYRLSKRKGGGGDDWNNRFPKPPPKTPPPTSPGGKSFIPKQQVKEKFYA